MTAKPLAFALCVLLPPLLVAQQSPPSVAGPAGTTQPIVLRKGTVVKLVLLETVSSAAAAKGRAVRMVVESDVTVDGVVVIPRGTPATSIVAGVRAAVPGKRDGWVSVNAASINPAKSTPIALRHYNYTLEDDGMCSGFLNCLPLVVGAYVLGAGDLIAAPFHQQHADGNDEVLLPCSEEWSVLSQSVAVPRAVETGALGGSVDLDKACPGGARAFIP